MSGPEAREANTVQARFLAHLIQRLDVLAEQSAPWDGLRRLRAVIAARLSVLTEHDSTGDADAEIDPDAVRVGLLAVELHRLRRVATAATLTLHGGHRHEPVRIGAVGRCHTVVRTAADRPVLVPLRFIASVRPHEPAGTHR
ncbi:hypothetical protein ACWEKT_31980 [Nocardia takedensis]